MALWMPELGKLMPPVVNLLMASLGGVFRFCSCLPYHSFSSLSLSLSLSLSACSVAAYLGVQVSQEDQSVLLWYFVSNWLKLVVEQILFFFHCIVLLWDSSSIPLGFLLLQLTTGGQLKPHGSHLLFSRVEHCFRYLKHGLFKSVPPFLAHGLECGDYTWS